MNRSLGVVASIAVAATISACGAATTSSTLTTPAQLTAQKAEAHLVRLALAAELAALRQRGGWRTVRGPRRTGTTPRCTSSGLGFLARAGSPLIEYRNQVQLSLENFLYSNAVAATRALRRLGSKRVADCFEKLDVVALHDRSVGAARLNGPKSVRAGAEALAASIVVPVQDRGPRGHYHSDYVFARSGRLVVWIVTGGNVSNLAYDVKLAGFFTQVPSAVRAARLR
jgi:hypothetical protein